MNLERNRIGIIGGGQLGKMTAQAAQSLGFSVWILDPYESCPASFVADRTIVGEFSDGEAINELASQCSVTTYDIEHINTEAMTALQQKSCRFAPDPGLLALIQDKGKQKNFLRGRSIPMPEYLIFDHWDEAAIEKFGLPLVQKTCRGGYDGRGVHIIASRADYADAFKNDFLIERVVDIQKELGIMVARNHIGEIAVYPVAEMVFNAEANICDLAAAPARINSRLFERAQELAVACVEAFQGVGMFGIELFLDREDNILYNEIAPRPHNSGHYTIEACETSQFEQHIRAIMNLPLGSTRLLSPAAMFNLLGEKGYEGVPYIEGFEQAMAVPGLAFHFYRKAATRPFRKMGHVTITASTIDEALQRADTIKPFIRIITEAV